MQATLITPDATETLTYCDRCDEECITLARALGYEDNGVCPGCHAELATEIEEQEKQEEIDEARDVADSADGEVESIEAEIIELAARYKEEMAELKGRVAEARKVARAAKTALAKLEA